jgi:squalene-hopene/tetraprenyl-beta-curcumene cyclase
MTYAGLLSFIDVNIDKNDPRVQSAADWIQKNFTVDENYGMGKEGLYYNYHTMAKALSLYGEPTIVDAKGVTHDWYKELADKLISEQRPDGSWKNESSRWLESMPVLVTSYAVLALDSAYRK